MYYTNNEVTKMFTNEELRKKIILQQMIKLKLKVFLKVDLN